MPRHPARTAALGLCVAAGLGLGVLVLRQHQQRTRTSPYQRIDVVQVSAEELPRLGFRIGAGQPLTWSDISLRIHEDEGRRTMFLACRIAPEEAGRLVNQRLLPAVRPAGGTPPAAWPWRGADDRAEAPDAAPAWFVPIGPQAWLTQSWADGVGRGLFAAYDPPSQRLWLWQWLRRGATPPAAESALRLPTAVARLGSALTAARHPVAARGWLLAEGLDAGRAGFVLPGLTRIDAALWPGPGATWSLLRLRGIDTATACALLDDVPMTALPDAAAPPFAAWSERLPPGPESTPLADAESRPPAWFQAGPGWRAEHRVVRIGSGTEFAGRWAAWDAAASTLLVWDWLAPPR